MYGILYAQPLNKSVYSANEKFLNLIGIIETVLPMFDVEKFAVSNWSFSSFKTNIFAANEAAGFSSTTVLKTRPYIQDHLSHPNQKFVFSSLFFSLSNFYKVTITTNLTYDSGIAAVQLNFAQFEKRLQQDFFIIQLNGQILFGASNFGFQGLLYFYNESITGFDYEDWVQIRQQVTGGVSISNCNQATKYLCRYSNVLNKEVMFYLNLQNETQYLIVILKDIDIDTNLKNQISYIDSEVQQQISKIISYQGYASLVIIILSSIVINSLFFDLNHMVRHCKQHIFTSLSQGTLLTPNYYPRRIQNNNVIHQLIRIFYIRLRHQRGSQYTKSLEALYIEELIYPRDAQTSKLNIELNYMIIKSLH